MMAIVRKFALPALLILTLLVTPGFSSPAAKRGKSQKPTAKKVVKKKSSRTVKAAARSVRGQKSSRSRVAKGKSRKSGRVQARSRRGRGRTRARRPVVASSRQQQGINKFLSESWASAQTVSPRSTQERIYTESAIISSRPTPPPPASVATPDASVEGVDAVLPVNPLVAAFADSFTARRFNLDNQGFILETLDGEVLAEHNADKPFNPASVVKVATSLAVISKLGPEFRFRTSIYTDGTLDPATGVLNGSLYLVGSGDPAFFHENAMMVAEKLNRSGIREVNGNLYVLGPFYFDFSASREASARAFRGTLNPETWNAEAKGAFPRFLSMRYAEERLNQANGLQVHPVQQIPPSLKITGETISESWVDTGKLNLLAVHSSLQLIRVLKVLNDFSNNWMASMIGNLVGGPDAVERILQAELNLKPEEVNIVTSSGLGSNYISPRTTVTMFRKLSAYLQSKGLSLADVLPVAGIDQGTLERRFTDAYRGSVVAKTGTLSGVSALAGVAYTRERGPVLFVIYNRGGSPAAFRPAQDETVRKLITLFGGPAPIRYSVNGGAYVSEKNGTPTMIQGK